ncbi:helix-turn-helix domain-containing protein [Nicoliella lavandulae]|uniref:Helix-turn-helix transcriptional regulator n=1 Tax=Nicoliella lavandulae TaxID=3082954 RepID=A0ABU8SKE7_9LACO
MAPLNTIDIKSGSIKILGSLIQKQRKQRGLSQSELADNICSQGLISLIENKNIAPSLDVIYNLCLKLELKPEDVIIRKHADNKTFDKIEAAIWNHEYEVADQLMRRCKVTNLDSNYLKGRYYCYLGEIEYRLNHNYRAAIKAFNEVLLKYSGLANRSLYTTWSHVGNAKAYLKLNENDQAHEFMNLSMGYLKLHQLNEHDNFKLLVDIYVESIRLYQDLSKFKEALHLSEDACQFLISIDSMYQMGALNLAMARSLIADQAHAKAINYLDKASLFCDYYNDHYVLNQVNALRAKVDKSMA